jgi:ferrous iron transport protein A
MYTLAELNEGDSAVICKLESNGGIRRRLQDIGLIPGTKVECIQKSPLGDPAAYLFRRTVIALRCEDSSCIIVQLW